MTTRISLFLILVLASVLIKCEDEPRDGVSLPKSVDVYSNWPSINVSDFCLSSWVHCDEDEADCKYVNGLILKCNNKGKLVVLEYNCVTYNESEGLLEAGLCLYNTAISSLTENHDYPYTVLTSEEKCTEFNRTGSLCGRCKDGHYPLAYSYGMNCVECPDGKSNWWKFVLAAFLPLTLFYIIVLFINLNITSSYFNGFVFNSQIISTPSVSRMLYVTIISYRYKNMILIPARFLGMFYAIWNLDFLRPLDLNICLGTDTLQTLALDIAVGIFPFILMILTYLLINLHDRNFRPLVVIWKPFHALFSLLHRNWEIRTSLIDSFATFFLLTNVKFLSVSFDLLAPVQLYQINSTGHVTSSPRLYYDATIHYFGERHAPYAILATVVLLFFVLLPTLLLILYPFHWFQKFLNLFPVRWYVLHTFMDSFQGCFKNGTQPGTCDFRWFASVFFLARLLIFLGAPFIQGPLLLAYFAKGIVLIIIIIVTSEPFKVSFAYLRDTTTLFMLLLTLGTAVSLGPDIALFSHPTMQTVLLYTKLSVAFLPLLYIFAITLHWMYRRGLFRAKLIRRLCAWRRGYEML